MAVSYIIAIVAIEFAESWKPLMKSKTKATAMMKTM